MKTGIGQTQTVHTKEYKFKIMIQENRKKACSTKIKRYNQYIYTIIYTCKNPRFLINVLHNLHVQPSGLQFLIFTLNLENDFEFLIESGRCCHVFWPLYN